MLSEENEEDRFLTMDNVLSLFCGIGGVDLAYLLDNNYNLLRQKQKSGKNNYLGEIQNIIKSTLNIDGLLYQKPFHTYTLLNENGLIVISKLNNMFLVVVGGENDPVDLIALLKSVKEAPVKLLNTPHFRRLLNWRYNIKGSKGV